MTFFKRKGARVPIERRLVCHKRAAHSRHGHAAHLMSEFLTLGKAQTLPKLEDFEHRAMTSPPVPGYSPPKAAAPSQRTLGGAPGGRGGSPPPLLEPPNITKQPPYTPPNTPADTPPHSPPPTTRLPALCGTAHGV